MLNAKKVFGIDYNRIVICGDSAGGNLAIVITLMAIMRKFRVPDNIMVLYPSTICATDAYWPSLLNCFDEVILGYTLLNLI